MRDEVDKVFMSIRWSKGAVGARLQLSRALILDVVMYSVIRGCQRVRGVVSGKEHVPAPSVVVHRAQHAATRSSVNNSYIVVPRL